MESGPWRQIAGVNPRTVLAAVIANKPHKTGHFSLANRHCSLCGLFGQTPGLRYGLPSKAADSGYLCRPRFAAHARDFVALALRQLRHAGDKDEQGRPVWCVKPSVVSIYSHGADPRLRAEK
jgi:hypothetical protein